MRRRKKRDSRTRHSVVSSASAATSNASTKSALPAADDQPPPPPAPLRADEWTGIIRMLDLSGQQARILALILEEKEDKEIAPQLDMSLGTIRTHIERMFARTGARSRVGLVVRLFMSLRARG